MNFLIIKTIFSVAIVLGLTEISQKFSKLAGFLVVMPTISLLTIIFSHIQYGENFDIVKFYKGMIMGLPGLILFYVPFLFIKNFYLALGLAFVVAILVFLIYRQFNLI